MLFVKFSTARVISDMLEETLDKIMEKVKECECGEFFDYHIEGDFDATTFSKLVSEYFGDPEDVYKDGDEIVQIHSFKIDEGCGVRVEVTYTLIDNEIVRNPSFYVVMHWIG